MRERDNTLDMIKAIAIILVCLYHSYYLEKESVAYTALFSFCSMGVPLFFFVNGALLFTPPPLNVKKHFKKTGKVIFLTLVWVLLILSIIKLCILPEGEMSRTEFFKTLLYLKTGYVINQYWFLLALVMLYVFFPLFKRTFDSDKVALLLFTAIVFLLTFGNKFLYVAHQLLLLYKGKDLCVEVKNYIPFAFVYFLAGGMAYHYIKSHRSEMGISQRYKWGMGVLFVASWGISVLIGRLFMSAMKWDPCFRGYDLITTFLMTCCFCFVLVNTEIPRLSHLLGLVSKNTLGIYFVHGILIYITKPWVVEIPVLCNAACYVAYVVIILSLSLFIVLTAKRIPFVCGLFKL